MTSASSIQKPRRRLLQLLAVCFSVLIFIGEFVTPLGFAHGTLYLAPLLLAALSRSERFIIVLALVTIGLTVVGYLISPPGFDTVYVIANRLMSVFGISFLAVLAVLLNRGIGHSQRLYRQLLDSREEFDRETRRHAEELTDTLESLTDAFFTLDGNWCFRYLNAAAEELMQKKRQELIGRNIWELFPGVRRYREQYDTAMFGKQTASFQGWYTPRRVYVDVRVYPTRDGVAVNFRDISRERQQEAEAKLARERFEIVAKATTDAIWDWDLQKDTLWWNDSVESLFGYVRQELEPDSDSRYSRIHPDDLDYVRDSIRSAIEQGMQEWSAEYRFRRKDGSYACIIDTGYIIRDSEGRAIRMVGGMEDVTEKRLLQERLGQSQRLEAIGQLTGGVAHDFNNLLTVIQGNVELLCEKLETQPELLDMASMTGEAAARASELTRHLLAFARRQPLDPDVADIRSLILGMEALLRRTLMENINLEFVHGGGLWHAQVDSAQLENALLNLCLNARDAMPEGGRLTIETSNAHLDDDYAEQHIEVNPGQYVLIAVSDTGKGIPKSIINNVFDPFFTTKSPDKGTGLGLSMVFGFVKQSHGHIKIYSEVDLGTTVKVYLPKAQSRSTVEIKKATHQLRRGSETILLVEDDDLVRSYAEKLLVDLGYNVLTAADADGALEELDSNREIALLFTDIIMPGGMNGRQLAEEAQKRRPDIKVLYTSGYTENAIVHHGRLDPGVDLISKPYLRKSLADKIRAILKAPE